METAVVAVSSYYFPY